MVDQRDMKGGAGTVMEAAGVGPTEGQVKGRTQREIVWRRFKRHKLAMFSAFFLIFLYVAALAAPLYTPYGFEEQNFLAINEPPSSEHLMGTDRIGRDNFTRVVYGGRVSLLVGLGVGVGSTIVGTAIAVAAGYYGRYADSGAMGLTDFVLALPALPLLIVAGSVFNFTPLTIAAVLIVLFWPTICRLVRAQVLSLRESEFVQAAKAIGVPGWRIMLRHLLPNVIGVMVVQATLAAGTAILLESILSFLGVGIQPPTPSWGNMLENARTTMTAQWWLAFFPAMFIISTILCINFLGDGLRDALDPKAVE
jgi:peptide/nickel transport system permease protein